ncbi:MAG: PIN domain-containing protein [Pseudomonadota bacterium]
MILFDTTMLLLLMRPDIKAPIDKETGEPVEYAKERISALVEQLEKSCAKIIIPTPVLSELLVKADKERESIVSTIQKNSVFRIIPFDTLAAIEVAEIASNAIKTTGNKRGNETGEWAKIKYDRQIIGIAKVNRATAIYTDDDNLINCANSNNIKTIRLKDISLPDEFNQLSFFDEKNK